MHDLNGVGSTVEAVADMVRAHHPAAAITQRDGRFPFSDQISDAPLAAGRRWSLEESVAETLAIFQELVRAE